jgi:hypothetical protein
MSNRVIRSRNRNLKKPNKRKSIKRRRLRTMRGGSAPLKQIATKRKWWKPRPGNWLTQKPETRQQKLFALGLVDSEGKPIAGINTSKEALTKFNITRLEETRKGSHGKVDSDVEQEKTQMASLTTCLETLSNIEGLRGYDKLISDHDTLAEIRDKLNIKNAARTLEIGGEKKRWLQTLATKEGKSVENTTMDIGAKAGKVRAALSATVDAAEIDANNNPSVLTNQALVQATDALDQFQGHYWGGSGLSRAKTKNALERRLKWNIQQLSKNTTLIATLKGGGELDVRGRNVDGAINVMLDILTGFRSEILGFDGRASPQFDMENGSFGSLRSTNSDYFGGHVRKKDPIRSTSLGLGVDYRTTDEVGAERLRGEKLYDEPIGYVGNAQARSASLEGQSAQAVWAAAGGRDSAEMVATPLTANLEQFGQQQQQPQAAAGGQQPSSDQEQQPQAAAGGQQPSSDQEQGTGGEQQQGTGGEQQQAVPVPGQEQGAPL